MSNDSENKTGLRFALFLGVLWAVLLGAMWIGSLWLTDKWELGIFIGRHHILIVHIPIGLLCLAGVLEILAFSKRFSEFRRTALHVLWFGVLGSIAATLVGFVYMKADMTEGSSMTWHLWTGLGVVVAAIVALILKLLNIRVLYEISLAATIVLVGVSSHYGGNMVHGSEYLTEYQPAPIKRMFGQAVEEEGNSPKDIEQMVIYEDIIQPIFDAKCVECHSAEKTKGKLRMDSFEELAKGGDIGEEFIPGDAEGSELVFRVTLPADDDEFMPPSDKDPMTVGEIALMSWWIEKGASPNLTVAEAGPDDSIRILIEEFIQQGEETVEEPPVAWRELSEEERNARMQAVQEASEEIGFSMIPVSEQDDRLSISVVNCANQFGNAELAALKPVESHIAWLDLARSKVTDEGMKIVSRMKQLEQLHLENTSITDAGVARLAGLTELDYLNLYGTKITDASLAHLSDMRNLRKLYLWQTEVTPEEARRFQKQMSLEINVGWNVAQADSPETETGTQSETTPTPKPTPAPPEKKPDQPQN